MTVETILGEKGRDIVTLGPAHTLREAVQIMSRHRIGAIVVVDEGRAVQGIVSERDVVRALAEAGPDVLDEPVGRRMTTDVVTCSQTAGVPELMGLMTEGKFRHVPVVEGGHLVGIVSIGDIVKHRLAEVEAEHNAMRDYITTA